MRAPLPLTLVAVLLTATGVVAGPGAPLPRSSPESQGIPSRAIRGFIEAADTQIDAMHSFMLVRHGHVVAEGWWAPYHAESPHTFFSLTKSFTSTAVGFAVAEGRLSLDDTILSFFPDAAPAEPGQHLKGMRVRDVLAMSTGHHADVIEGFFGPAPRDLPRAFLALPVAHKPGTHFVYNTPGSHILSEIVQKVTGEKLSEYLRPRLLEPLGIHDLQWAETADGVSLGGYGIAGRTEDIAKFGLLYLQKGRWGERQLLPETWVAAATSRQTSNGSSPDSDWDQGYGYQFWRTRHGLYRGDGAFGQYCIVFPEHDAVVAITSGVRNMQAVMNLVWERILPALQPAPLGEDRAEAEALRTALAGLTLRPPAGAAGSAMAADVSGKAYAVATNPLQVESLSFDFNAAEPVVTIVRAGQSHRIVAGREAWRSDTTGLLPHLSHDPARRPQQPAAAAGAWTTPDTYTLKLWLTETPFALTWSFRFNGEEVVVETEQSVAFGPTRLPQLTGRRP